MTPLSARRHPQMRLRRGIILLCQRPYILKNNQRAVDTPDSIVSDAGDNRVRRRLAGVTHRGEKEIGNRSKQASKTTSVGVTEAGMGGCRQQRRSLVSED